MRCRTIELSCDLRRQLHLRMRGIVARANGFRAIHMRSHALHARSARATWAYAIAPAGHAAIVSAQSCASWKTCAPRLEDLTKAMATGQMWTQAQPAERACRGAAAAERHLNGVAYTAPKSRLPKKTER